MLLRWLSSVAILGGIALAIVGEVPWEPVAEEAVIASGIADSTTMAESASIARPEMFSEKYRPVWIAMLAVHARGEPTNLILVSAELAKMNELDSVGGQSELAHMVLRLPTTLGAEYYAKLVAKAYQMRRVISAGSRIAQLGYDTEPVEAVTKGMELLGRIASDDATRPMTLSIAQVIDGVPGVVRSVAESLVEWAAEPDAIQGIPLGWPELDEMLGGLQDGRLYTFMGRTSVGKSQLYLDSLARLVTSGTPAHVITTEMPFAEIAERMVFLHAGVNSNAFHEHARYDLGMHAKVSNASGAVHDWPLTITSAGKIPLRYVLAEARRARDLHHARLVVVDVIQDVKAPGDTQEERIREVVTELKGMAVNLNLPVIAISHVSRDAAKGGRLNLHSGFGAGAIEQASDTIITLEPVHWAHGPWELLDEQGIAWFQQEFKAYPVEATVWKNRRGDKTNARRILNWKSGGRWEEIDDLGQWALPRRTV